MITPWVPVSFGISSSLVNLRIRFLQATGSFANFGRELSRSVNCSQLKVRASAPSSQPQTIEEAA